MIGIIGHLIVLIVGYGASFLFLAEAETTKRELTLWGWLARKRTLDFARQHEDVGISRNDLLREAGVRITAKPDGSDNGRA